MKNFSPTLLAFLAQNDSFQIADLIEIDLLNGTHLYVNTSAYDITFGTHRYLASAGGVWERGTITSEAAFDMRSNTMSLTVKAPGTLLLPNTTATTYMGAALLGLFDAAQVTIRTIYWPVGSFPPVNTGDFETKFVGFIIPNGKITRSRLEFEVADALYILNQKVPRNIMMANCRHTLGDANCTIDLTNPSFNENNTVKVGSTTQLILLGTAASRTAPFYSQGFIQFTSGQNIGQICTIKQQNGTASILLAAATTLPLGIGDAFLMVAGCDKTIPTCISRFNNFVHNGSTPFVPNPEAGI